MAVISNKLRNFAVAKCQSLKEIVAVLQNISTAPHFSRQITPLTVTPDLSWCHSLGKRLTFKIILLKINMLHNKKPLIRKTSGIFCKT